MNIKKAQEIKELRRLARKHGFVVEKVKYEKEGLIRVRYCNDKYRR